MYRIALLLVCTVVLSQVRQENPVPVNSQNALSVCAVLRDLERYGGKVIEVTGEWSGNLMADCPPRTTGNYIWPNILQVEFPSAAAVLGPPASWSAPEISLWHFALIGAWHQWQMLPESQKRQMTVMATMVGRLDVGDLPLRLNRDGGPSGYGPQNIYPAQLVVSELKGIKIAPAIGRRTANAPQFLSERYDP